MTTPYAPRPTLDREAVRSHFRTALRHRTPAATRAALADIPVLLAELERALSLATQARAQFANLLAAARTALAAEDSGEAEPLYLLRDEVAAHEPVPAEDIDDWGWL